MNREEFLFETFKQANEHIRATDRKYWVTSVAFIGMISVFITRTGPDSFVLEKPEDATEGWSVVVAHAVICIFGLFVFTMQSWFRTWKEHYIHVGHKLRETLIGKDFKEGELPYWMVHRVTAPKFSFDNLLALLTFTINAAIALLVAGEILVMTSYALIGIVVAGVFAILIIVLLVIAFFSIRPDKQLTA